MTALHEVSLAKRLKDGLSSVSKPILGTAAMTDTATLSDTVIDTGTEGKNHL